MNDGGSEMSYESDEFIVLISRTTAEGHHAAS